MMKITPYFGNVYIDQFKRDLYEIRSHGFDAILHPVSETDVRFHSGNIQSLIKETKRAGFTAMVDPHCLGNLFGYGNLSAVQGRRMVRKDGSKQNRVCPKEEEFAIHLINSFRRTVEGADWVLWDEPDISVCFCSVCRGTRPMIDVLPLFIEALRMDGVQSSICFWAGTPIRQDIQTLAYHVDDIGISIPLESMFELELIAHWMNYVKELGYTHNKSISLWYPGYSIQEQDQDLWSQEFSRLVRQYSPDNIGTWGFRGCEAWSYAACENPRSMWETIGRTMKEIDYAH